MNCSYCDKKAVYETVVSGVYLCDSDSCWLEAVRNEFIDGELEDEDCQRSAEIQLPDDWKDKY